MSPETTLIIILVFGTAAIASSLVVLKTWLLERRMPRVAWGWATCTTALLMTGLLAAHYSAPERGFEYRATGGAPEPGATPPVPRYSAPWLRTRWSGIVAERLAEQSRVDEMHRQFAPTLEQYRQKHGVYPAALEDAGIRTPVTRYGPLHYYGSSEKSDPWYLISFGDIERDRFSADWDSRKQAWGLIELEF